MTSFPTLYFRDKVRATKVYNCCTCRGEITKGEHYIRHKGVWDGEFNQYRDCEECDAARKQLISRLESWEAAELPLGSTFEDLRDFPLEELEQTLGCWRNRKVPTRHIEYLAQHIEDRKNGRNKYHYN